jgi:hypothetical protein
LHKAKQNGNNFLPASRNASANEQLKQREGNNELGSGTLERRGMMQSYYYRQCKQRIYLSLFCSQYINKIYINMLVIVYSIVYICFGHRRPSLGVENMNPQNPYKLYAISELVKIVNQLIK